MKRRDFILNSIFTSGSLALTPWATAHEAVNGLQFRDGHSFFVDSDGSAHMLAHNCETNMFQQTKLFAHGEVLDAENQVIYDRNHLLLTPFNHPKRDSNLLLYCEFNTHEKTLSHYHFLQLNTENQTAAYVSSYQPTGAYGELTGHEKLLLLLDNMSSDDIATFLYQDAKGILRVGTFQNAGKQGLFTPVAALDENQSRELADARWCGPYDNLVGKEKNVFFAVLEGVGIQIFQFDGMQLTQISNIENGRSFGNFTYRFPKLTMETVAYDRTVVFEVITPHAPEGVLSSRDVLMLTSDNGVHYLNYNVNAGDFELVHENRDFFNSVVMFHSAQVNAMKPNQPDLLMFRDDDNHMFATLAYRDGQFVSKLERIPAHIVSPRDTLVGFPVKRSVSTQNDHTGQGLLAASAADDAGTAFHYPLTFVSKDCDTTSFYHLNVASQPDGNGNHGSLKKKVQKKLDNNDGNDEEAPADNWADTKKFWTKPENDVIAGLLVALIAAVTWGIYCKNSHAEQMDKLKNKHSLTETSYNQTNVLLGTEEIEKASIQEELRKAEAFQKKTAEELALQEKYVAALKGQVETYKEEVARHEGNIKVQTDLAQQYLREQETVAGKLEALQKEHDRLKEDLAGLQASNKALEQGKLSAEKFQQETKVHNARLQAQIKALQNDLEKIRRDQQAEPLKTAFAAWRGK